MSKAVSGGQALQAVASLSVDTPWDELDGDILQKEFIELTPKERGARFAAFFKNGCRINIGDFFRETGEFTLEIPALKRPTLEELRRKDDWIQSIERDNSPEGPVKLKLVTVLRPGEDSIGGKEYELRLMPIAGDALGHQHLDWLIDNQDKVPAKFRGKFYIDFPGIVVVDRLGYRDVPYAYRGGKRWDRNWYWLGDGFDSDGRVALPSK